MPKPIHIITEADLPQQANPRAWQARSGGIPRIAGKDAKAKGWHKRPGWVGRPGVGLTPFQPTDPRVDPEECTHCQIKDIGGMPGPVSRCLDCGALVETAARVLLLEVPEEYAAEPDDLTDSALDTLRQQWNNAHWGAP